MEGTNRVVVIEASLKGNRDRDFADIATSVREEVEFQNRENYKVLSVTNLTRSYQSEDNNYPYAESFTCGVLIVFELITE